LGIYTEKGINRSRKEKDEHLRVSTYPRGEKKVSDHFPSTRTQRGIAKERDEENGKEERDNSHHLLEPR